MKAGTLLRSFTAKDGREVTLRAPKWSDLDEMLEFINSLVREGADITVDREYTRDQEVEWLAGYLSDLERGGVVGIAAEVDGRFVGQLQVSPRKGLSSHVGVLGISVMEGYRGMGIGTEMMIEAEAQAKRLGIEVITLEVFATNDRALRVYLKLGYEIVGRIPKAVKRDGVYIDSVVMAKEI